MKNRPLLCVCLVLLLVIGVVTTGGGKRFIKELRPSPVELYAKEKEKVTVQGTIYRQEQKDTYQKIYLKNNSVYLNFDSSKSDEKAALYGQQSKISNSNQFNTQIEKTNKKWKIKIHEDRILVNLKSDQKFQSGNKLRLKGEVFFFDSARNFGNFDQKFYYQKQDIHAGIWAEDVTITDYRTERSKERLENFRRRWKRVLKQELGEEKGAILTAILLGEKGGMDQEVKELYQANGVGHILAISGLHLSFIGVGMYRLLRRGTGSYWAGGIVGGILLMMYVLMIGMTVSVIRAWVMFIFRIGADITGRHYDMPTALSVAAVIAVYSHPLYILDGGFWLSFGAVFAICVSSPLLREVRGRALWSGIALNIVLWPVILYCFYEMPVYSVVLNLIILPCMSVLLSFGIAGSVMCSLSDVNICIGISKILKHMSLPGIRLGGLGKLLMKSCGWILDFYETICRYTLKLPKARWVVGRPGILQIVIYYLLLCIVVIVLYRSKGNIKNKKRKMILTGGIYLCGFIILTSGHRIRRGMEITMLDVGQGDCICVEAQDGCNYLVDGGSSDVKEAGKYRIESFLKARGIGRMDYVFVSHGDADHISGIEELIERQKVGVKVSNIVLPSMKYWDENLQKLVRKAESYGVKVWVLEYGQKIKSKDLTFECLGPWKEIETGNEASMILHLSYEKFDMLFTGDAEGKGEEELTEILSQDKEKISWEVLKVAHHGSKNSTVKKFLECMKPRYAWISAGRNNRYGHPHKETLERLEKHQVQVFSTQENGAISIHVQEKTMQIRRRNS